MKPVSLFLLAVCLLAVQAQDLASRTFGFVHSHPAVLQAHHGYSISAQAQGHYDHALPAHHGSHAGHAHQAHGHVHQGQGSNAHQHKVGHGHHHNHGHSVATHSATAPIASKVNTVPVLVKVPVNTTVPAAPSTSNSGSSVTQHVGSHIATSISHVFGRVVNPVVALLQNASVWLNRTAHEDPSATGLQHNSALPHTAVIKKKLAVVKKLGHQPMSTASFPALPAVLTDTPTTPSLETAVPSMVAEATTRSRPTTKLSTLAPVVVSTLGAPAPTPGVPAPRADTFPISTSTIASTDMPASVPEAVSKSAVAVQVADTTAAASESTLTSTVTSTGATLSTRAPTAHTTTSTQGPLNLRANSFTLSSTDLPASIHQEVSSTTRVAVDTTTLLLQSTLPGTVAPAETTARATLSTIDFTSTVATTAPTLGSLDPRADPFTALATSTDESTFGPVHREQANTATVTSAGTKASTPVFVESNTRSAPTSAPKQHVASNFPAAVGAASIRSASFTAAPTSVRITSAPPSAAGPTILLPTEAPSTVVMAEDITVSNATNSAITLQAVALSPTPEPASSQPGKSTTIDAHSVRPKSR